MLIYYFKSLSNKFKFLFLYKHNIKMVHQASVGKHLNKKLKVFSNQKLMNIATDMLYHNSIAYLKTEVKIEKEGKCYVLHYHYNLIEDNVADCGELETRNIAFSYLDPEYPNKEFYSTGTECLFFDDPQLLHDFSDTYKKLLLKKYTLLSFIYEYKNNTNFDEKTKNVIFNQLKRVKNELLFRFNNEVTLYDFIEDSETQDYVKFHKSEYPVKSLEYKSNYIEWNGGVEYDIKIEPNVCVIKMKPIEGLEEEPRVFSESESESESESNNPGCDKN